jgi:hypothetical protein
LIEKYAAAGHVIFEERSVGRLMERWKQTKAPPAVRIREWG